jgi:hypothetical protein
VDCGGGWRQKAVGNDPGNDGGGGGGQQWVRPAHDGDEEGVTACVLDGGGGVTIIDPFFLLARQSHHAPRIVKVPILLLVRIVRVHYLYPNPKICKYQIFSTDMLYSSCRI